MKTDFARLILVTISGVVLAVAASSVAQELTIDVPAPAEPGRIAGDGKEAAKPIPLRRLEPREPDRRDSLQPPGLTAPSLNPAASRVWQPEPRRIAPEEPLWLAPNSSRPVSPRERPSAGDDFRLDRAPSWANPAASPLHQNDKPKDAAKPRARSNQRAATASSESRGAANRAAGAEADAPRGGLLNFGARLGARRAGQDEPAPFLARWHRPEPRERNAKQPPKEKEDVRR